MDKSKRQLFVHLISSLLGIMALFTLLYGGKEVLESLVFSILLGLLTVACFRWWTRPAYNNLYDYFSPLAILSTLSFVYMGIGNIMPFIDHELMRYSNPDADKYYILPLLASLFGVILFDVSYRLTSVHMKERERSHPLNQLSIENLSGFRIKVNAVTWYVVGMLVFEYMSAKYVKFGISYMNVTAEIDNILNHAALGFFYASWCALSLLLFTTKSMSSRLIYGTAISSLFPVLFSYSSRSVAIIAAVISGICFLVTRPNREISLKSAIAIAAAVVTFFVILTGVKTAYYKDDSLQEAMISEHNLRGRFVTTLGADGFLSTREISDYIRNDSSYRIAGLEFPAAIERAHNKHGIAYMFGYHNLIAVSQTIPRIIWPGKLVDDPESVVVDHFGLGGVMGDQMSTLIGSAYADGGLLGVLIGMPLIAIVLCLMQGWVWSLEGGFIIYLANMNYLANFETFLLSNPLMSLRFILIMVVVNFAVRSMLELAPGVSKTRKGGSLKQSHERRILSTKTQ